LVKITLVCDRCGGNVELDDTQEFGFCAFCKSKVLIKNDTVINEVTQYITKHVYGHQGKDVDELIADGNKLLELGDIKSANVQFKNAIDVEPTSWIAWLGYAATGGDRTKYLSCVSAYRNAYQLVTEESQDLATFNTMVKHFPDENLGEALIKTYKNAPPNKRREMFPRVLGVIGRDDSVIAGLAVELCPDDWRAWFAQGKIRQVRVRWCEKKLNNDAIGVLNFFVRAYQLAERESAEAKKIVLSHFTTMEQDGTYENFMRALNARINSWSTMGSDENSLKKFVGGLFDRFKSELEG